MSHVDFESKFGPSIAVCVRQKWPHSEKMRKRRYSGLSLGMTDWREDIEYERVGPKELSEAFICC